jgi:hypothetical protein
MRLVFKQELTVQESAPTTSFGRGATRFPSVVVRKSCDCSDGKSCQRQYIGRPRANAHSAGGKTSSRIPFRL